MNPFHKTWKGLNIIKNLPPISCVTKVNELLTQVNHMFMWFFEIIGQIRVILALDPPEGIPHFVFS